MPETSRQTKNQAKLPGPAQSRKLRAIPAKLALITARVE